MKLKRLAALCTSLTLTLSLAAVPAHAEDRFNDIENHWAREDVLEMANRGYAKGYDDGSFKPDGKMTAAETLLFCARAAGVDSATQTRIAEDRKEEMEEVLPGNMASWAAKEMAVAVEAGVLSSAELESLAQTDPKTVTGTNPAGRCYLEQTITRENICMYLVRAMQLEPLAKSLSNCVLTYEDADSISVVLRPYVYVLTNFGIVKGTDTGDFDPKGAVTRGQMTTMLRRALDFMASSGIVTELSEYTDYSWRGGLITAVTTAADGSTVLAMTSQVSGSQSYALPATVKIYEDNMLTSSTALKAGKYVRLNFSSKGVVTEARLSGSLTTYEGTVSSLAEGQLSLFSGGQTRNLTIDRFTEVMVGKNTGDRSIIDEEAGYSAAVCFVDEMGHLAAVKFSGGTQLVEGLVEGVTTANGVTTLGVATFNGVVYRYTLPIGAAVAVNGALGSLTAGNVGDYVQVRVNNDNGEAVSVGVDTVSNFIQGPVKKLGTVGTAKTITVTDRFTGKEEAHILSPNVDITYNGESRTTSQLEAGWYATILVSGGYVQKVEAYSGSVVVEGVLSGITYGATTVLQVTQADDSIMTYDLDITNLPTINRSGKSSSIDKLRTGDRVAVTIRYNKVEKIDSTPQTANLTGAITKITMETAGVTMEVTLSDGSTATYTVSDGVSVTQDGASANIYSLKPGYTVGLVTNGDEVVSIDITATASSATQLAGTVYTITNTSGAKTMTVLVTGGTGTVSAVTVDVRNANLVDVRTGGSLSLNTGFAAGDTVTVYGSYEGAVFIATLVVKQ